MNSSGFSEVRPGPVTMLSTGTSRWPPEPAITQVARAAISGGTLSAAGEALHRLPASDARPWIWVEPIRFAPSTMPGQACRRRACSPITAPEVAAPMTKTPSCFADAENARDLLGVDDVRRLHPAGAQLDQQVGPAGQDLRAAGGSGEDANGVLDGRWGRITERRHGVSRIS